MTQSSRSRSVDCWMTSPSVRSAAGVPHTRSVSRALTAIPSARAARWRAARMPWTRLALLGSGRRATVSRPACGRNCHPRGPVGGLVWEADERGSPRDTSTDRAAPTDLMKPARSRPALRPDPAAVHRTPVQPTHGTRFELITGTCERVDHLVALTRTVPGRIARGSARGPGGPRALLTAERFHVTHRPRDPRHRGSAKARHKARRVHSPHCALIGEPACARDASDPAIRERAPAATSLTREAVSRARQSRLLPDTGRRLPIPPGGPT